ncbi:MAG: hypothetical protein DHS20C07_20630 [Methyloligella sp.]|nr:MAG: hypothetical protein DHS20C07_20630 [Methyloligella sp.]
MRSSSLATLGIGEPRPGSVLLKAIGVLSNNLSAAKAAGAKETAATVAASAKIDFFMIPPRH